MAKYRLYKNNNKKSVGYNKYYAHKKSQGMVESEGYEQAMVHTTPDPSQLRRE